MQLGKENNPKEGVEGPSDDLEVWSILEETK